MAASPQFKVYDPEGNYEAACNRVETAAAVVAFLGNSSKIRWQHRWTVWTEGAEQRPAAESYDYVSQLVSERVSAINQAAYDRRYGRQKTPRGDMGGPASVIQAQNSYQGG